MRAKIQISSGDVFVDAWKILFTLLVDENDEVRSIACQIIQIVSDHCHVTNAGMGNFCQT